MMVGLLIDSRIMRYPLNSMICDVVAAFFPRRNVFTVSFAVNDLGLVPSGIDLNFEIVRRFSWRSYGDDFYGFSCRQHSVHTGGADADSLLATAHPQTVKL